MIEGELYVSHGPGLRHQAALDATAPALGSWLRAEPGRGHLAIGPGVVFALATGVIPDLAWASETRLAASIVDPETGQPAEQFYQSNGDALTSPRMPGFSVAVSRLFSLPPGLAPLAEAAL